MTTDTIPSAPDPDLALVLAKARLDLASKRADLADATDSAAERAADRLMAGDAPAPAKDLPKLQADIDALVAAIAALEQRALLADEAAKGVRAQALKDQADQIHAEYAHTARMLLAISVEAVAAFVRHTQQSINPALLFAGGENRQPAALPPETETALELAALRAQAEAIGRGGWVNVQPARADELLPTAEHRTIAAGLLSNLL